MRTETLLRVRLCTECARNCQGSSGKSGHDQTIKNALQARSSDQDRILDDQDFDPGRGRFHRRVLGDYPLLDKMVHISTTVHAVTKPFTPMCSPCDGAHQKNNGLLI